MPSNAVRSDQVRTMLDLLHEASEIGPGREQRSHLVHGIRRIVGGAKADRLVDAGFGPALSPRVEELFSSFGDSPHGSSEKACIEMSRNGCRDNLAYNELTRRPRTPLSVTRRRELVRDAEWYRSEFFNNHLRVCRLDDQLISIRRLGRTRVETIAVTRELGDTPFADEDRNLMELFHLEVARLDRTARRAAEDAWLTPRENDVLRLLLSGAAEKAVAAELGISQQTVHGHVKSIYAAFGVQSRAELLVKCLS